MEATQTNYIYQNKLIFIFVEGDDDKRFIEKVISPILIDNYSDVKIVTTAETKNDKINSYVQVVKNQKHDYIFLSDFDSFGNKNFTITERKEKVSNKYKNLTLEQIQIVVEEIESWLYAGISNELIAKYNLKQNIDCNLLTKEKFENDLKPKSFNTKTEFVIEILANYSIDNAKVKNHSFRYFLDTFIIPNIN